MSDSKQPIATAPAEQQPRTGSKHRFAHVAIALGLLAWASLHLRHLWFSDASVDAPASAKDKLPNIIFIITDDQDATYDSLEYMPSLQKHLIKQGANFVNHHVTTPVCCPSRTSVLRSQFVHNHNLSSVFPPYGGYTKFREDNLDDDYLPLWLKQAGYQTYFTGKFVVEYSLLNYKKHPAGWDIFDGLVWPWTFDYEFPVFARDGGWPKIYWGAHQTDVVIEKTESFLKTALKKDQPFFLYTAPSACHTTIKVSSLNVSDPSGLKIAPPIPLPRHAHLFPNVTVPRTPNFNEPDFSKKPLWMQDLIPQLKDDEIVRLDEAYRQRLRSLQGVDELVEKIVTILDDAGELDNTYIFYTTDNGYHLGAHRLGMGKEFPYEEDIRVPLVVRGPGVEKNTKVPDLTLHVDLATTFTALAGQGLPRISDGKPLPLWKGFEEDIRRQSGLAAASDEVKPLSDLDDVAARKPRRDIFPIEFWEDGLDELTGRFFQNNTWKAVKITTPSRSFKYAVRCSGDRELYDLKADPYEINNLLPPGTGIADLPAPLVRVASRADALLSILGLCKRGSCLDPFKVLARVPGGISAADFEDALDEKHDAFFNGLVKFGFRACLQYPDPANEISFLSDILAKHGKAKILGVADGKLSGTTLDGPTAPRDGRDVEPVVGALERLAEPLPVHLASWDLKPLYESLGARNYFK
ncbi:arylsulfatase 2 precursor [Hyaloraphidium curvatum]|nr:arylsulfatase 2 precursor [Hyaloraphidium curvatum]